MPPPTLALRPPVLLPAAERAKIREKEEKFQLAVERLQERFPNHDVEDIERALKEANGHAGRAAAALRGQTELAFAPVTPRCGGATARRQQQSASPVARPSPSPAAFCSSLASGSSCRALERSRRWQPQGDQRASGFTPRRGSDRPTSASEELVQALTAHRAEAPLHLEPELRRRGCESPPPQTALAESSPMTKMLSEEYASLKSTLGDLSQGPSAPGSGSKERHAAASLQEPEPEKLVASQQASFHAVESAASRECEELRQQLQLALTEKAALASQAANQEARLNALLSTTSSGSLSKPAAPSPETLPTPTLLASGCSQTALRNESEQCSAKPLDDFLVSIINEGEALTERLREQQNTWRRSAAVQGHAGYGRPSMPESYIGGCRRELLQEQPSLEPGPSPCRSSQPAMQYHHPYGAKQVGPAFARSVSPAPARQELLARTLSSVAETAAAKSAWRSQSSSRLQTTEGRFQPSAQAEPAPQLPCPAAPLAAKAHHMAASPATTRGAWPAAVARSCSVGAPAKRGGVGLDVPATSAPPASLSLSEPQCALRRALPPRAARPAQQGIGRTRGAENPPQRDVEPLLVHGSPLSEFSRQQQPQPLLQTRPRAMVEHSSPPLQLVGFDSFFSERGGCDGAAASRGHARFDQRSEQLALSERVPASHDISASFLDLGLDSSTAAAAVEFVKATRLPQADVSPVSRLTAGQTYLDSPPPTCLEEPLQPGREDWRTVLATQRHRQDLQARFGAVSSCCSVS
eukprot:TRINITY_DN90314_c0_g1_i1.p1 TRINITY_DN90314_c0_g1~~TRINITY_DN90314_c0_g1_i1.p1  ORF type:complete len:754 (-),score=118.64 TRINITY_DN90314_c0_g1_i1:147-2408(-)